MNDLTGTNAQRRIEEVANKGNSAGLSYQLKSTSGKFNAHAHMYTEE